MAPRLRGRKQRNHTEAPRYVKVIKQKREMTPHGTTKTKHPRELGNGYHEAESTGHCLLKVSSCEPGNRNAFNLHLCLYVLNTACLD